MYLLRYNAQYPFKGPEKDEPHPVIYMKQIIHDNNNNLSNLTNSKIYPDNGLEFIWTYDILNEKEYPKGFEPRLFLERMKEVIEKEDKFILLTAYSIVGLKDTEIDTLLIRKARDEKIKTIIVIDKKNKDRFPKNLKELEKLENFNVFYHPGTHAKFMLTSKYWMMVTANIDGIHCLRNSFEVGILGNDEDIFTKFKEFYLELLAECPNSKQTVPELSRDSFNFIGCDVPIELIKFSCSQCSKKFKTQSSLDQHFNDKHQEKTNLIH